MLFQMLGFVDIYNIIPLMIRCVRHQPNRGISDVLSVDDIGFFKFVIQLLKMFIAALAYITIGNRF